MEQKYFAFNGSEAFHEDFWFPFLAVVHFQIVFLDKAYDFFSKFTALGEGRHKVIRPPPRMVLIIFQVQLQNKKTKK